MHEAAALIAGGSIAAARPIADRAGRPGGQHRRRPAPRDAPTTPSGFCVYNDARWSRSRGCSTHGVQRVAYVDVDVHHGDGVQAAFYDDPRVLTVSLHEHPRTLWPGHRLPERDRRRARRRAPRSTSPLPAGTADAAWLRAFHAVVPGVVRAFRPQVLVTQCGCDTHRDDPLADLTLTVDGQRAAYRALRDLADRARPAAGGWPSAAAATRWSGWCPGPGPTCWPPCSDRRRRPDTAAAGGLGRRPRGLAAPRVMLPASMTRRRATRTFRAVGWRRRRPGRPSRSGTRRAVFPLHGLDPDDPQ